MSKILNASDIDALVEARTVLARLESEAASGAWNLSSRVGDEGPRPQDFGRLSEAAHGAEYAIFRVLNVAQNYAEQDVTEAQLHSKGREREAAA